MSEDRFRSSVYILATSCVMLGAITANAAGELRYTDHFRTRARPNEVQHERARSTQA
jgi:hypothetical protein